MNTQTQSFDQWLEDEWLMDPRQSQIFNTTSDTWKNYTCLNDYDTLKSEDVPIFNELDFVDNPLTSSDQPSFQPPSPISDISSSSAECLLDTEQQVDAWDFVAAPSNNPITSAAMCDITFADDFPVISDFSSPSSASEPNSPLAKSFSTTSDTQIKPATKNRVRRTAKSPRNTSSASSGRNTHNLIEKKYRTNLNNKIMCLRDRIPSLSGSSENEDDEECENKRPMKWNKGVILEKAIDYISQLETQKETQALEILKLRSTMNNWRKINLQSNSIFCNEIMRGL